MKMAKNKETGNQENENTRKNKRKLGRKKKHRSQYLENKKTFTEKIYT